MAERSTLTVYSVSLPRMIRILLSTFVILTLPLTVVAQEVIDPDVDGDGLLNTEEDRNGDGIVNSDETDPYNADSDGGGEADGSEVQAQRDPLDRTDDLTYDLDNDGLTNGQEDEIGTDRANPDTDTDNINDKDDPFPLDREFRQDSDNDGLPDAFEIQNNLARDTRSDAQEDTDGDGLSNLEEFVEGTDVNAVDTDQDGVLDGKEVELGTDPLENPCLYHAGPTEVLHDLEGHWSKPFVRPLQETKITESGPRIIEGYAKDGGSLFKPNQEISRFELLKIALLSSCISIDDSADAGSFSFTDLQRTPRPFEDEDAKRKRRIIYTAYDRGIITGYGDRTFRPDDPVNRAEALKILFLTSKLQPFDDGDYSGQFLDVEQGTWYEQYVNNALSYEFIEGYEDKTFRPDQSITRAEAAKVVLYMVITNPHVNGYVIPVEGI